MSERTAVDGGVPSESRGSRGSRLGLGSDLEDRDGDGQSQATNRQHALRQGSMFSIMQGVRERMDSLAGTPAAQLLNISPLARRSRRTTSTGSAAAGSAAGSSERDPEGRDGPKDGVGSIAISGGGGSASVPTSAGSPHRRDSARRRSTLSQGKAMYRPCCTAPFRVAVLCPIFIMLIACLGVFVPIVLFSIHTQEQTFDSYQASVDSQEELIKRTLVNATTYLFTQVLLDIDKEVFVNLVEPPDRAVSTLWGALRLRDDNDDYEGAQTDREEKRRQLAARAWEELWNQWACDKTVNKVCAGRADSLYVAWDKENFAGSAFRSSGGQTEARLFDAPGGQAGVATTLSIYSAHMTGQLEGQRDQSVGVVNLFMPSGMSYFTGQEDVSNSGQIEPKSMWSEMYTHDPWNHAGAGELVMSYTRPITECGTYACFEGVVAADVRIGIVGDILRGAWDQLNSTLLSNPWTYTLDDDVSSVFIVNQVSPNHRSQEGFMVGASDPSAMNGNTLVEAINSPSSVVAAAAKAVLAFYGSYDATALTEQVQQGKVFYYDQEKAKTATSKDELGVDLCDPSSNSLQVPSDCMQVATHTFFLDNDLQWLVVVVLPAAAFSTYYVEETSAVQESIKTSRREADDSTQQIVFLSATVGGLMALFSFAFAITMSCVVIHPLRRLGSLMKRLGHLDFAHDSEEFEKLLAGKRGHLREVNDLQDAFCRLSTSTECLSKFVPEAVVQRMLRGDEQWLRLHVDKRQVTILFSDVRDFTSISEKLKPDDLLLLLTMYLTAMTKIIEDNEGVVGEVLGDGVLAFWNTPERIRNHAGKACSAALRQQQELATLNEEFNKQNLPSIAIRIGLHTGEVLTGNIGSLQKMKFGCMGDPVNLASRLEGLCKVYGVGVLCSEATVSALPDSGGFVRRKLDLVQVKGRAEPTKIYELLGTTGTVSETRLAQVDMYEKALQAYQDARFSDAVNVCEALLQQRPEDQAAKKLLAQSKKYVSMWRGSSLSREEMANWTGVVAMTDK